MTTLTLNDFWSQAQKEINCALEGYLPPISSRLHEAMHYVIFNGGKRLRALLVYAVAEVFGEKNANILNHVAAAIECMHSYSLVHDDLPAMDDDDLRRGKPSCHVAFDEATAILCGDTLQCFAFGLLAKTPVSAEKVKDLIILLSDAVGSEGMALGQHYDLISRCDTAEELRSLHYLKTGRLIQASVLMAYTALPHHDEKIFEHLSAYGEHIGLAYQICDDILDCESSTEALGKPAKSDIKNKKTTFVTFYGLDEAKKFMQSEVAKAKEQLAKINLQDTYLSEIADLFIARVC